MALPHSFFRSINLRKFLLAAALLFQLLYMSTQEEVCAQCGSSSMNKEFSKKGEGKDSMIGSRPPLCEKRCLKCGRCEAVQIPIAPDKEKRAEVDSLMGRESNYKPMNWKCKCGDFFFNP